MAAAEPQQQLLDAYGGGRKRELEDDYEDEDDASGYSGGGSRRPGAGSSSSAAAKRARRHGWQQKYESEFGLVAIEKDHATGDVVLAMCGFCKAFGREGKYEQLLAPDASPASADGKKRRRRSLTTTKFFRAFRVDNIRSHLQGAHPRRWAEFEMLPKQEALRARFLQLHGDLPYDALHMVDDVVLHGAGLSAPDADLSYAQPPPPQPLAAAAPTHSPSATGAAASAAAALPGSTAPLPHPSAGNSTSAAGLNGGSSSATTQHLTPAPQSRHAGDFERHVAELLALDRERFEFQKAKFKKQVELRERELALRESRLEQDRVLHAERLALERVLHEKRVQAAHDAALRESSKLQRLADAVRDAVANAASGGAAVASRASSVV